MTIVRLAVIFVLMVSGVVAFYGLVLDRSGQNIAFVVAGLAVLFAPLAFAGSRAGLEIVGPMATVVLGGLAALTLYSTVLLPAFYLRWGFVKDPDKSVRDIVAEAGKSAGGEIKVAKFVRFKLGEATSE